ITAAGDRLVLTWDREGVAHLAALHGRSWQPVWQHPVAQVFSDLPATVALVGDARDGLVYLSGALSDGQGWWHGTIAAVDAADGTVVWENTDDGVQWERRLVAPTASTAVAAIRNDADVVSVDANG